MQQTPTAAAAPRIAWRAPRRRAAIALAVLAAALLAMLALGVGGDADPAHSQSAAGARAGAPAAAPAGASAAAAVPVSVRMDARRPGHPVPPLYLGLSFEISALPQIAAYAYSGDFTNLLRSLGTGVLRFGGISADTRIAWTDSQTPRPAWASGVIDPADLRELRVLAQRSGWRVMLTVGIAHYEPRAAAREVAAARRILGPWLGWIEIGNEPDSYGHHHLRSTPWTFARYDAQVKGYRRAIAALTPGVPIAGPGVSGSHIFVQWGSREVVTERPALLTGHHYPLGCAQVPAPSIPRLLAAGVRVQESSSLNRYMAISRASGIPFRMDETNSVSCGGRPGISNTFASALWATSYIARTMAAGVAGVNLHGNPANCLGYSPVCASSAATLAAGDLRAQPVWYALLLTRGLIGDRPLTTTVSSPRHPNMSVTALRSADGSLQFVIVEDDPPGSPPASVRLQVGAGYGSASVLELTAPSPQATTAVRLGGAQVSGAGSWRGASSAAAAAVHGGTVTVSAAPSSAMLVTVAPAAAG